MKRYIVFLITILFLTSCATTSKLITRDIKPGMHRNDVIRELGTPVKKSSYYDDQGKIIEELYFKEKILIGGQYRIIENILLFKEDMLIEINQGDEYTPYTEPVRYFED